MRLAADHRPPEQGRCEGQPDREDVTGPRSRPPAEHAPRIPPADGPNISSPPMPVSSEPPRADSITGTWKCALHGQSSPWRARHSGCHRPDAVQLARPLDPDPVREAEVLDDLLLPLRLGRSLGRRESQRRRNRVGQALATRHEGRDREHRRRVTAAREADDARSSLQRGEQRPFQCLAWRRAARRARAGAVCRARGRTRPRAVSTW